MYSTIPLEDSETAAHKSGFECPADANCHFYNLTVNNFILSYIAYHCGPGWRNKAFWQLPQKKTEKFYGNFLCIF